MPRRTKEEQRQLAFDFETDKKEVRTATDPYEPFWKRELRRVNKQVVNLYQENTELRARLRRYEQQAVAQ